MSSRAKVGAVVREAVEQCRKAGYDPRSLAGRSFQVAYLAREVAKLRELPQLEDVENLPHFLKKQAC